MDKILELYDFPLLIYSKYQIYWLAVYMKLKLSQVISIVLTLEGIDAVPGFIPSLDCVL